MTAAQSRLLALLRLPASDAAGNLPPADAAAWEDVLRLARRQFVAPLVWSRIRAARLEGGVPGPVRTALERESRQNALRNLALIDQLARLVRALEDRGIPVLLLKGLHVAQELYRGLDERVIRDIDFLVRADRAADAANALRALGYSAMSRASVDERAILAVDMHLPPMVGPGVAPVEVHASLGLLDRTPAEVMEEVWRRAVPVDLGPVAPLGLSREDLVLHLCVHASYQHLFAAGLRPCCDLAGAIDRWGTRLDWEAVCERAVRWRWRRGVRLALDATRALLGAAPPGGAVVALGDQADGPIPLQAAIGQIFIEAGEAEGAKVHLARLVTEPSLGRKARWLAGRLFVSDRELGSRYPVPAHPLGRWRVRGVRIAHLVARHAATVWKLARGDPRVRAAAARAAALADWLATG